MIVVNSRAGQLSNRLVVAAHAMVTAIGRGESPRWEDTDYLRFVA